MISKLPSLILLFEYTNLPYYFKYCQTLGLVLRLRVDFVLPMSQEQKEEQQQEQPTPKSISGEYT